MTRRRTSPAIFPAKGLAFRFWFSVDGECFVKFVGYSIDGTLNHGGAGLSSEVAYLVILCGGVRFQVIC
ncbi:hypothetical protein SLA2020_178110 [Shorea laevis]